MKIEQKKEKLINKEISISDLNSEEVEKLKQNFIKDINLKKEELREINNKIKEMKVKIDNWAN